MERPSWANETGIESALIKGTNKITPEALRLIREMKIPIIRFPGGTDIDYLDWTDMIDNVPDRDKKRPVSVGHQGDKVMNNFGYDEFLQLCEDIGAESILTVNFRDGLLEKKPIKEAAMHAASLVAYCNASLNVKLPEEMNNWPSIRAKNGRTKPYGIKYVQIGNETNFFIKKLKELHPKNTYDFYIECLNYYIDAIRIIDPAINIIIDYLPEIPESAYKTISAKVQYLAVHSYYPMAMGKILSDEKEISPEKLSDKEIWYSWISVHKINERGESIIFTPEKVSSFKKLGYKIAVTEWNWNGWWNIHNPPYDSDFAKGVGAAGYIHSFMRASEVIEIGCQSMLIGKSWGITGIRVDPSAKRNPYFMPTAQVAMFYSKYHGDTLISYESSEIPTYSQHLQIGSIKPQKKIALIDAIATADKNSIYFHAVNRHFEQSITISIDISDFSDITGKAIHHNLVEANSISKQKTSAKEIDKKLSFTGNAMKITLPNKSISCIEIKRKQ